MEVQTHRWSCNMAFAPKQSFICFLAIIPIQLVLRFHAHVCLRSHFGLYSLVSAVQIMHLIVMVGSRIH